MNEKTPTLTQEALKYKFKTQYIGDPKKKDALYQEKKAQARSSDSCTCDSSTGGHSSSNATPLSSQHRDPSDERQVPGQHDLNGIGSRGPDVSSITRYLQRQRPTFIHELHHGTSDGRRRTTGIYPPGWRVDTLPPSPSLMRRETRRQGGNMNAGSGRSRRNIATSARELARRMDEASRQMRMSEAYRAHDTSLTGRGSG